MQKLFLSIESIEPQRTPENKYYGNKRSDLLNAMGVVDFLYINNTENAIMNGIDKGI